MGALPGCQAERSLALNARLHSTDRFPAACRLQRNCGAAAPVTERSGQIAVLQSLAIAAGTV
jgi:hypothetical protein